MIILFNFLFILFSNLIDLFNFRFDFTWLFWFNIIQCFIILALINFWLIDMFIVNSLLWFKHIWLSGIYIHCKFRWSTLVSWLWRCFSRDWIICVGNNLFIQSLWEDATGLWSIIHLSNGVFLEQYFLTESWSFSHLFHRIFLKYFLIFFSFFFLIYFVDHLLIILERILILFQ